MKRRVILAARCMIEHVVNVQGVNAHRGVVVRYVCWFVTEHTKSMILCALLVGNLETKIYRRATKTS